MFDVGRSSFKTTLYGLNVTCECLQNKLALIGSGSVVGGVLFYCCRPVLKCVLNIDKKWSFGHTPGDE